MKKKLAFPFKLVRTCKLAYLKVQTQLQTLWVWRNTWHQVNGISIRRWVATSEQNVLIGQPKTLPDKKRNSHSRNPKSIRHHSRRGSDKDFFPTVTQTRTSDNRVCETVGKTATPNKSLIGQVLARAKRLTALARFSGLHRNPRARAQERERDREIFRLRWFIVCKYSRLLTILRLTIEFTCI